MLLASVHANTEPLNPEALEDLDVEGVGGSHTTEVYPVDLIRHGLSQLTLGQWVASGDILDAQAQAGR
jgi:hypothetical protein